MKRPTSPTDRGPFFPCAELPPLLIDPVAPPGSRLVVLQDREAEHPAPGGEGELGGGELRELHAARAGEVEIPLAGDEEIPPDVHDQGLAVGGIARGVVPGPGESAIANEEVSYQGSRRIRLHSPRRMPHFSPPRKRSGARTVRGKASRWDLRSESQRNGKPP